MRTLVKSFVKRQLGPHFETLHPYLLWGANRVEALAKSIGLYEGSVIEWDVPEHAHCVSVETTGPGRGELFGVTLYSSISAGTEVAFFQRQKNTSAIFPSVPGYSLCGRITKVGRNVHHIKPGQLIAVRAAHRSFFRCPAHDAFLVPDSVSPQEASLVFLGAIAMNCLWTAEIASGDRVCIIGRGTIGMLVTQMARCFGAKQVFSMARHAVPADDARGDFADEILSEEDDGWSKLANLEPNLIIEASGSVEALSKSIQAVRSGGRVILLGSYRESLRALDLSDCANRRVELRGCHIETLPMSGASQSYRAAGNEFLELVRRKKIRIGALTKSLIDPYSAGTFYRDLAAGKVHDRSAIFDWSRLPDVERLRKSAVLKRPDSTSLRARKMYPAPIFSELSGHETHMEDRAV